MTGTEVFLRPGFNQSGDDAEEERSKLDADVKSDTYIGLKLTQDGIRPDDNKVRAINEMPAPSDK